MSAKKTVRVSIGQFSKMTRLSVKALRLYDEKGLLCPDDVDESTGYRYYHLAQARQAEIIRVLRMVDMPLRDIAAILGSDNHQHIGAQLLRHKQRLTENLAAQERMLDYLESIISNRESLMPYEITTSEPAGQFVAAVKLQTNLGQVTSKIATGFGDLVQGLGQAGVTPAGMPMIIYHDTIDAEAEGAVEIAIPVGQPFDAVGEVYGRELEGGTMATTVHRGSYSEISPAYHTLTKWVSENGYEIAGPPREIYLNDPNAVAENDLLTRLEFPVCPGDLDVDVDVDGDCT